MEEFAGCAGGADECWLEGDEGQLRQLGIGLEKGSMITSVLVADATADAGFMVAI